MYVRARYSTRNAQVICRSLSGNTKSGLLGGQYGNHEIARKQGISSVVCAATNKEHVRPYSMLSSIQQSFSKVVTDLAKDFKEELEKLEAANDAAATPGKLQYNFTPEDIHSWSDRDQVEFYRYSCRYVLYRGEQVTIGLQFYKGLLRDTITKHVTPQQRKLRTLRSQAAERLIVKFQASLRELRREFLDTKVRSRSQGRTKISSVKAVRKGNQESQKDEHKVNITKVLDIEAIKSPVTEIVGVEPVRQPNTVKGLSPNVVDNNQVGLSVATLTKAKAAPKREPKEFVNTTNIGNLLVTEKSCREDFVGRMYQPLRFERNPEKFLNASLAPKTSRARLWSYHLYESEQGKEPEVIYAKDLATMDMTAQKFLKEKVVGFDMEWRAGQLPDPSNPRESVSLIQVASDSTIALFHIALLPDDCKGDDLLPKSLRDLIENPEIIKTGSFVTGDMKRLASTFTISPAGAMELKHFHHAVLQAQRPETNVKMSSMSLDKLAMQYLAMGLDKDALVRCGDWTSALSWKQLEYAANDAYAGLRIFDEINADRFRLSTVVALPTIFSCRKNPDHQAQEALPASPRQFDENMSKAEINNAAQLVSDNVQIPSPSLSSTKTSTTNGADGMLANN